MSDGEITPGLLTRTEIQMLQDALIWSGVYVGLKDGGWGRMSAEAVREWRRQRGLRSVETFSTAEFSALFEDAIRARNAVGWANRVDPNTGVWIGLPMGLLRPGERREPFLHFTAGTDYGGSDGRMEVTTRTFRGDIVVARETVGAAIDVFKDAGGVITYRLDRPDRQVASLDAQGRSVYIRYDRSGSDWRGFIVVVKQNDALTRNIITAISAEFNSLGSPTVGGDAPVLGPVLGALASRGIVAGGTAPVASATPPAPTTPPPALASQPAAAAPAIPPPTRREISGSGTGFAVRRDGTMMTNHHVVRGCGSLALHSGERVTVVATDPTADLAILRVQGKVFETITRFRRDQTIDLGEPVTAFGYPHYQSVSTALNITNGIVSALVGIGDDPANFQINAAIQPGNSGGPVLDNAGLVIGVAVSRLNDRRIMAATGTIPQTMNYAIRGQGVSF
jgi:S1-C subfamily serine protease